MRILILGGSGMLGCRLWMELSKVHEAWITVRTSAHVIPDLPGCDRRHIRENVEVANFDTVVRAFASIQPDVVINCIGLVKQLPLSNDPLSSLEINAVLPHRISLLAKAAKSRMIHFSTDCVFSGRKDSPYTETDPSDAKDLYGRSKFLGEVSYGVHTLTLRTSIVGRELRKGYGLVEWFLGQDQAVRGYQKALFSGLTTGAIAKVLLDHVLPHPELSGVYHLSSYPISKCDLLCLINDAYGRQIEIIPDETIVCNRVLDSAKFRRATGFIPSTWPEMILAMKNDSNPFND